MRAVESCPHREPVGDGEAACLLLGRITGVCDKGALHVRDDACRACCAAPMPGPTRLNSVVASLVDGLAGRVAAAGGVAGCDPERATALTALGAAPPGDGAPARDPGQRREPGRVFPDGRGGDHVPQLRPVPGGCDQERS